VVVVTQPYYTDDQVTLYHGDCLDIDAWLDADVLVTDPPYGMAWESGHMYDRPAVAKQVKQYGLRQSVAGDNDIAVRDDVLEAWGDKPAAIFGTWRQPRPPATRHRLIWDKQGRYPGLASAAFYPADEEIYIWGDGWTSSPPQRSVITTHEMRSGANSETARLGHPTPKPVQLLEIIIGKAPPGVIADPFAGAGSTLLAARNLGRRAIGVELEERYCEIIARRLAQGVL
jgi:site-specific DNA-methyltransferase (adenine-specific)